LLEVLLHAGTEVGGWTAREIHQAVLDPFELSERQYGLNSLRYDLRKLKGHGLLNREPQRYAYRLSSKGQRVPLLFLLFHRRLFGPLAGTAFVPQPDVPHRPRPTPLEAAYDRVDQAVEKVLELLPAA
jgi:hypothetical protein